MASTEVILFFCLPAFPAGVVKPHLARRSAPDDRETPVAIPGEFQVGVTGYRARVNLRPMFMVKFRGRSL